MLAACQHVGGLVHLGSGTSTQAAAQYFHPASLCPITSQVAKVVLLEQLYRAWTILRGEPYHH